MENVSAGSKEGRRETPVSNFECSDTWDMCSPVTGDTYGGKNPNKTDILGQVNLGNKECTKEDTDSFSPEAATSMCHY